MKISKKAIKLMDKGLSAQTVSKLSESQIDVLYSKLSEAITQSTTTSYNIPTTDAQKGVTLPIGKKATIQQNPGGAIKITPTEEVSEETKEDNKTNPYAICTAQLGPKFGTNKRHLWTVKEKHKYERCVKDVKNNLKEGKNPVSLFLENEIMRIVEKNIQPRITKSDLLRYLNEQGSPTAPTKPKTLPNTKPGQPKPKPNNPLQNPFPGENPSPRAVNPEQAKDEVINAIMKILNHG